MKKYKYFIFNKPAKTFSSLKSIKNILSIRHYIDKLNTYSLHLVGRLDYWSRGLLLLTNNGILSNKLIHPSFKVPKEYIIKTKGIPTKKSILFIKYKIRGVCEIQNIGITPERNSWFKITLNSGANKQIVNIFWGFNVPVIKIIRVSFANINVANLLLGNIRELTNKEILILCRLIK